MTQDELQSTIIQFMDQLTTMTLGCSLDEVPWTAPVYYARQNFDLIFFSSKLSRHSMTFEKNPRASASIYGQYNSWKEIKGLQLSGNVQAVNSALAIARATKTYLTRYPFVKEFLTHAGSITSGTAKKMTNISLYAFRPDTIYYMDNSQGFGTGWTLQVQMDLPKRNIKVQE